MILDGLIAFILILLTVLGFYRGGLRELCTGAGLLLGVAIVSQWATNWGDRFADAANINDGASRFMVAMAILVITTMICGYGSTAAFAYQPGPGGRMYGALLGLLNGIVFTGYAINYVRVYLLDGDYPKAVDDSYVARGLSVGIEWVLLAVGAVIVLATAFGWLVREEAPDQAMPGYGAIPPDRGLGRPVAASPVVAEKSIDKVEPAVQNRPTRDEMSATSGVPTAPMRIREVRHWEEPQTPPDLNAGWSTTWPVSASGESPKPPWDSTSGRRRQQKTSNPEPVDQTPTSKPAQNDSEVLRRWLADEPDTGTSRRPSRDE